MLLPTKHPVLPGTRQPTCESVIEAEGMGFFMTTAQSIAQRVTALPEDAQQEVLDFVEFIETRKAGQGVKQDATAWSNLSLASAMRGMEDEESPYTLSDLKESFQ